MIRSALPKSISLEVTMSKTKSLKALLQLVALPAVLAAVVVGAQAQTIAEIAELQRAKLRAELNKPKADAEAARPVVNVQEVAAVAAARKIAATISGVSVHALYVRGSGGFVAELTDGRNLMVAIPGAVYGPNRVIAVRGSGVEVAQTTCKKDCASSRVIPVGGAF